MSSIMVHIWRFLMLSVVTLSVLTVSLPRDARASNTEYSGQATVLGATVLGVTATVVDTGPLPSEGGAKEAALLERSLAVGGAAISAQVLHASTIGQGDASRSEASAANVVLDVGDNIIMADLLVARASAECSANTASVFGDSEILGLSINGEVVEVSGEPNQTVLLPGGRVVINEQSSEVGKKSGEITVIALHVIIDGLADVAISRAHADIACVGKPPCAPDDFVTGGGFITGTPSGDRGNFGVAGGIKNGLLWGHLNFIDHGSGMHVKDRGITAYEVLDETTRLIRGEASVDGDEGYEFEVVVSDNGEPGRNDTFSLELSNDYSASGTLQGGNIQLHPRTCP